VTEWAEIRHLHEVDGVAKKELARRFGRDVKTIRRALDRDEAPLVRRTPRRGRLLDPYEAQIRSWLSDEPKITARRIAVLVRREGVVIGDRAVAKYVKWLREEMRPRESFVHRSERAGRTLEIDFMETCAVVAGRERRLGVFVAVLPWSNAIFAQAYATKRTECWLSGIAAACRWLGGLPERLVADNDTTLVARVGVGREREERRAFAAFRGALSMGADFCAPARGNEKGSVEGAVRYVRANCFRPMPEVADLSELNTQILMELEVDQGRRRVRDGRTVAEALCAEREHLRPLPERWPATCREEPRMVNKYGHVRAARSTYSVPIEHAYRPCVVRLHPERVEIAVGAEVVARHERSYEDSRLVLDPLHVLPLLAKKARAASEATALRGLSEIFWRQRAELVERLGPRRGDREWVQTLLLAREVGLEQIAAALGLALERGTPRLASVEGLLRTTSRATWSAPRVPLADRDLAGMRIEAPELSRYDALLEVR
jgi:transposase